MMTKEEYEKELVRMWDSLRTENIGLNYCEGVSCKYCPLLAFGGCKSAIDSLDIYKAVKEWSDEHPQKKHKVSQLEYDILLTAIDFSAEEETFNDIDILYGLLKKGYFNGSTTSMRIREYLKNCEVA